MRGPRAFAWLTVATALALLEVGQAGADVGAGISASPLVVVQPVRPGATVNAGAVRISNTGTDPALMQMSLERTDDGLPVDPAWVRFEPAEVRLAPKASTDVRVTIDIPDGTKNGDYHAYILVRSAPEQVAGASSVGAAAATDLRFTVRSGGWPLPPNGVFIALGVVLAAGCLAVLYRQSGFEISVRRR